MDKLIKLLENLKEQYGWAVRNNAHPIGNNQSQEIIKELTKLMFVKLTVEKSSTYCWAKHPLDLQIVGLLAQYGIVNISWYNLVSNFVDKIDFYVDFTDEFLMTYIDKVV